jgi:uncharacterized Zn finger protein
MSFWNRYPPYVPVAERRAKAKRQMEKLRKKGKNIQPVEIEGRKIAQSFWGKGWCDHLESFSDYANRLPRGRTYVRNGSVCHLEIQPGRIEAMVAGSSLYEVTIAIRKLKPAVWRTIKKKCSGQIGSMLELLQGKLSDQVMSVVTDRKDGLFPKPGEIELACSCPDWATMCKHVASVLYGVGSRLDTLPEFLFLLRDVDAQELIASDLDLSGTASKLPNDALSDDQLGDIFGIEIDTEAKTVAPATKSKARSRIGATGNGTPKKKRTGQAKSAKSHVSVASTARSKKTNKSATRQKKATQNASGRRAAAKASASAPTRIRPTGKSVARLRKRLGLPVAQFAEKLGVTPASVRRWESTTGRLQLQARTLSALASLNGQGKTK